MELVAWFVAGGVRVVACAGGAAAVGRLVERVVAAGPAGVVRWVARPAEPEALGQPAGHLWLTIGPDGGGSLRYVDPQEPQVAWHTGSSADTRVPEAAWRAAVRSFAVSGQRPAEVAWQPALPEDAPQAPVDDRELDSFHGWRLADEVAANAPHGRTAQLDQSAASGHLRAAKHGVRHAQAVFEMLAGEADGLLWGDLRARLRYAVQQLTVLVPALPDPPGEPTLPAVEGDTMLSTLLGGASMQVARENLTTAAALVEEAVARLRVAAAFPDVIGGPIVESVIEVMRPVAGVLRRQADTL